MRIFSFIAICTLASVSTFIKEVHATVIFDGGVDYTNSFSSVISYSGFGPSASMEAFIVSDTGQAPFAPPGINVSGTDGSIINPLYALVTGALPGDGLITLSFAGTPAGTLLVDLLSYNAGGNLLPFGQGVTGRLTLQNGSFGGFAPDLLEADYNRTSSVPEPTTLALMALGLVGMAYRLRRNPAH